MMSVAERFAMRQPPRWRAGSLFHAFRAEWLKLRRRPVVLVLLLWTVTEPLGYLVNYVDYQASRATAIGAPFDLSTLLPQQLVSNVVSGLLAVGFGTDAATAALAGVVLGAMVAGSDHTWGTVKTALMQGPGRLAIFGGQVLALFLAIALLILADVAAAGVGSVLVALLAHRAMSVPPLPDLAHALAGIWLVMATWSALGVLLATTTRGTGVAMGLGIAWITAGEGLIAPFTAHPGVIRTIAQVLPKANTDALAVALSPAVASGTSIAASPTLAPWVLAAYLVIFLALAAVAFERYDVA